MQAEIMDELWVVVALVLTIAGSAASVIRKNKEARKTASRRIAPTQLGSKTDYEDEDANLRQRARKAQRTQDIPMTIDTKSTKTMNEGRTPETEGIAAEFDLRKAVLYSEILHPKFEE